MNINVAKIIMHAVIIVIIVVLIVLNIPWLILMIGGQLSPNPPIPKIQHEEFPFRLEYEIDGQKFEVKDTLICDFDGIGFSTGSGEKYRKWKAKLKSGKTRITLFENNFIEIYYFPVKSDSRLPGVFMDDEEYYSGGTGGTFPDAWCTTNFEDHTINDYIITSDEMMSKYNLRLISWEIAPPIQNKFK